jgi:replicative DNA helicase
MTEQDFALVTEAVETYRKLPLEYIEAAGMSVREVQAIALRRKFDVIFVDYLQLLRGEGQSRYEIVTEISVALHTLAQKFGLLVVALAQLSRPAKGSKDTPDMASLRESGQIEQDADVIMLLYLTDPKDNRGERTLKLAKNKDGEHAQLRFAFDGAVQRFTHQAPDARAAFVAKGREVKGGGKSLVSLAEYTQEGFLELTGADDKLPF